MSICRARGFECCCANDSVSNEQRAESAQDEIDDVQIDECDNHVDDGMPIVRTRQDRNDRCRPDIGHAVDCSGVLAPLIDRMASSKSKSGEHIVAPMKKTLLPGRDRTQ